MTRVRRKNLDWSIVAIYVVVALALLAFWAGIVLAVRLAVS